MCCCCCCCCFRCCCCCRCYNRWFACVCFAIGASSRTYVFQTFAGAAGGIRDHDDNRSFLLNVQSGNIAYKIPKPSLLPSPPTTLIHYSINFSYPTSQPISITSRSRSTSCSIYDTGTCFGLLIYYSANINTTPIFSIEKAHATSS